MDLDGVSIGALTDTRTLTMYVVDYYLCDIHTLYPPLPPHTCIVPHTPLKDSLPRTFSINAKSLRATHATPLPDPGTHKHRRQDFRCKL